jgi:small-conductance mechanosensitive channel
MGETMQELRAETLSLYQRVMEFPLFTLGDTPFRVSQLIALLLVIVALFVLERLIRRSVLSRLLARTSLQPSMQYAIARIFGYLVITFGFFVALQTVGVNLTSLTVIAGAIGVGAGFGLQTIVANLVSGVIILTERPVALGDFVEVGGVGGRVRAINLRSTTVVTNDNISIIVPNSEFITSTVVNYSHGDPKVRVRLKVRIAYGSDVQAFRRAMLDVAKANPEVMEYPEPDVFLLAFGESGLEFEVAVWARDTAYRPLSFRSKLFYAIEAKLRDQGIEVALPQRDLHVRSSTHSLPVRLDAQESPGRDAG